MESSGLREFVQRFQILQQHRETSDGLIKDILMYCENVEGSLRNQVTSLSKELQEAHLDLEDSKHSRRELQQQLSYAKQQVGLFEAEYDAIRNRNPYIIVLIDGDGMIFNENYIRQGIEGGKQAAAALRRAVLDYCRDLTDEIEILAKVCANVSGLAKAMRRDGSLENIDDFKDFTLGFTQGKASFDFVDVGHGKERADSKIKECMRWHLRNHNCKQILLGISHDAGYAPFIDEVVEAEDKNRITIIEGPPTVRELVATNIQIVHFDQIFRAEKLTDRTTATALISSPGPSTWATVSAIPQPSTSPNLFKSPTIPLVNGKQAPSTPQKPAWNPGPRGLDSPLIVNPTALEKLKRRGPSNKLCNNHYLRGPCVKDECNFEHDYAISEDERKALAYLARLNPCTNDQYCEVSGCIYGHHCPSVNKVNGEWVCTGYGCKFSKEEHPPGTIIKNPRKERWEGY